jgi:aryl carrier-like protein
MSTLQFGESGEYAVLVKRPLPEGLALVFIPSLAALLTRAQQLNDAALTENQVLRIRDGSNVMVVGLDAVRAMEEQRGYADIDAADAWQSWLRLQGAQA